MSYTSDGSRQQTRQVPITLDRESPVPLYRQLYDQLAAAILNGTLSPGERFEQELSLVERLGLSRLTIRRTLANLVNHGLLVRGRGIGTVVAHHGASRRAGLTSLHADLVAAGHTPTTRLLTMQYPLVDPPIATRMALGAKTTLLRIERLRLANGSPLAILRNWLPPSSSSVRSMDLEADSLYSSLRRQGINPERADQTIGSRRATPSEGELLNINPFDPVLTLTRISFDEVGHPVEYGKHTYRADRHEFNLTV